MKIKILIADDNSFIREGMKIILNTYEEFEVVDTVNDGEEAVAYCKSMKLILLFRCSYAKYERVEATKFICEETKTKPLILTTFDDDEYILDAVKMERKVIY